MSSVEVGLSRLGNFPCGYYGWLNSAIRGITAFKKKKKKRIHHDFTAFKALLLSYYVAYIVSF